MSIQATIYGVISTLEKYTVEDAKRILFQMVQQMEHGQAREQSAQPIVTHLNMDPNASPETKAAVGDMVRAAYAYKPPQQQGKELTQDKFREVAHAFVRSAGFSYCPDVDNALKLIRYLSDNSYLSHQQPSSGVVVAAKALRTEIRSYLNGGAWRGPHVQDLCDALGAALSAQPPVEQPRPS